MSLLKDRETKRKLQADFTQYYGADLRELYDPQSKMTFGWVVAHATQLPKDSRIRLHLQGENLNQGEHLTADIIDLLIQLVYVSSIGAASQLKDGAFNKLMKKAPKSIDRGSIRSETEEKKEKPRFVSGKELRGMATGFNKPSAIHHSAGCINSHVYADTGSCGCPVVEGR